MGLSTRKTLSSANSSEDHASSEACFVVLLLFHYSNRVVHKKYKITQCAVYIYLNLITRGDKMHNPFTVSHCICLYSLKLKMYNLQVIFLFSHTMLKLGLYTLQYCLATKVFHRVQIVYKYYVHIIFIFPLYSKESKIS